MDGFSHGSSWYVSFQATLTGCRLEVVIIIIIEFLLGIPGMALGVLGARILDGEKFLTRLDPSWWGVKIVRRFLATPTQVLESLDTSWNS